MLEAAVTAARIGADLDAVLSVDAIRIYKPQPAVYAMVTDRFSAVTTDIAFVSSNRWDVMGATAFGFRCVWVNRANLPDEYPEFAPVAVVHDLASLPALTLA
jgi:2-haloacid dehalogenase